jgi:hypothetical protein
MNAVKRIHNPRAKIADDGRMRRRREEHFTATAAQSVSISSVCYRSMMMKMMMTKTT